MADFPTEDACSELAARRRWLEAQRGAAGSLTRNRGRWGMRRVGLPDVGDGQGDDGRQASPMGTSFRRNWDRLINWGLAHTRQRGSSRHKLRRSMARAAGRRRSRLLRSPTEPRTMRSAAAKVAVILARSFVAGDAPPGRAGRNRQFRAGLLRGGRCLPTASPPIRANRFPAPAISIPCSVE
jgi:hypothetical protein